MGASSLLTPAASGGDWGLNEIALPVGLITLPLDLFLSPPTSALHLQQSRVRYRSRHTSGSGGAQWSREVNSSEAANRRGMVSSRGVGLQH